MVAEAAATMRPESRAGTRFTRIVEARRRPAERVMPFVPVSDHAVQCIDGLVDEDSGKSGNQVPEHRCDDAVGEVLRAAFDRRAAHAMAVEHGGVPPDEARHHPAPFLAAVPFERRGDGPDMIEEIPLGKQDGDDKRFHDPARLGDEPEKKDARGRGCRDDRDEQQRAAQQAPCRAASIETPVGQVDDRAEQHDRMPDPTPQPARVPDHPVENQGRREDNR